MRDYEEYDRDDYDETTGCENCSVKRKNPDCIACFLNVKEVEKRDDDERRVSAEYV